MRTVVKWHFEESNFGLSDGYGNESKCVGTREGITVYLYQMECLNKNRQKMLQLWGCVMLLSSAKARRSPVVLRVRGVNPWFCMPQVCFTFAGFGV